MLHEYLLYTEAGMSALSVDLQLQQGSLCLCAKFEVQNGSVTALFGRSGSGKTTLLRCLAGLQRFHRGSLICHGEVWQDHQRFVPPHQRAIGYVFQEASLFEHLNIEKNLAYGFNRIPTSQRRIQFDEAVHWMELAPFLQKRPGQLSGGQRQRVAIARALLTSPRLLLMDEPLSSLDHQGKQEILTYLERVLGQLGIPVIFVSHSPQEVIRLAQDMVLLENGTMIANGPLNTLLTQPDLPLAHFEEAMSVIHTRVLGHDDHYHQTWLKVPGGKIAVPQKPYPEGSPMRVAIQARDVSLALTPPTQSSLSTILPVTLIDIHADRDPSQVLVRLDLEGTTLLSRITRRSADQLGLTAGLALYAQVKSVALIE